MHMLDQSIIDDFRCVIHINDFVLFKYKNISNRNLWNCICSAMDWIVVAVNHLKTFTKNKVVKSSSIEFFGYIASVDILVTAIEQLHNVFVGEDVKLFQEDRSCFPNNPFNQTDRRFFKTIRACFGAHPVNLDEPGKNNDKALRRYASWSGSGFGKDDYSVILYSNQIGEDHIYLSVKTEELLAFAEKYYEYLLVLKDEISKQRDAFFAEMRQNKFDCNGDPLSRLSILKEQNTLRLNNVYYETLINELTIIFETEITSDSNLDMVEQYKKKLVLLIDEITYSLQDMNFENLRYENLLYPTPDTLPNGWGYWLEKLSENVFGTGYPDFIWEPRIKEIFSNKFDYSFQSTEELYILVLACLNSEENSSLN